MKNILRFAVLALFAIGIGPVHAACWQWSKSASPNATADPSINWSEGMAPSAVNDSARAMMAQLAKCRDDLSGLLSATGTSTVYAVATNQGLNSVPVDGQSLALRLNVTNGASATLVADGGTAYAIQSSPGVAVSAGTLVAGTPYRFTFNLSAAAWVLQDFYNAPIATNSVTYSKIQQVTASRLLGNATGSLANVAEIPLGNGIGFSGGALVNTGVTATQLRGYISGLTLSTAGSSAVFGVAAGAATDSTSTDTMVLAIGGTKTTSAYAFGGGNGALDTGTIANSTWYHVFLIKRPDTGAVDALISLSPTAPTLPANFTLFRRIGSMKTTAGGQWVAFTQVGDTFILAATTVDANAVTMTTSRVLVTTGAPTGVVTSVLIRALIQTGANTLFSIQSVLETDVAPTVQTTSLTSATSGNNDAGAFEVVVSTSAQIAVRSNTALSSYSIGTYGWRDTRGK